jgi:hypothetical protein
MCPPLTVSRSLYLGTPTAQRGKIDMLFCISCFMSLPCFLGMGQYYNVTWNETIIFYICLMSLISEYRVHYLSESLSECVCSILEGLAE